MKRLLTRLVVLIAPLLITQSCAMDFTPIYLYLQVEDKNGKDLLDPANDNSWLEGTRICYGDKVEVLRWPPEPQTKEFGPIENEGLILEYRDYFKQYQLTLGQFNGGTDQNLEFLILWPDDTQDVITFTRKFGAIHMHPRDRWKLNGVKVKDQWPIKIIR